MRGREKKRGKKKDPSLSYLYFSGIDRSDIGRGGGKK